MEAAWITSMIPKGNGSVLPWLPNPYLHFHLLVLQQTLSNALPSQVALDDCLAHRHDSMALLPMIHAIMALIPSSKVPAYLPQPSEI